MDRYGSSEEGSCFWPMQCRHCGSFTLERCCHSSPWLPGWPWLRIFCQAFPARKVSSSASCLEYQGGEVSVGSWMVCRVRTRRSAGEAILMLHRVASFWRAAKKSQFFGCCGSWSNIQNHVQPFIQCCLDPWEPSQAQDCWGWQGCRMQSGCWWRTCSRFYLCRTFGTSLSMVMRLNGRAFGEIPKFGILSSWSERSKSKERQCKSSHLCSLYFLPFLLPYVFLIFFRIFFPNLFPFFFRIFFTIFFHIFPYFSTLFSSFCLLSVFFTMSSSFSLFYFSFSSVFSTFFFPTFINILSLLLPCIFLFQLSYCFWELYPHFHQCSAYFLLCSFNFLPIFVLFLLRFLFLTVFFALWWIVEALLAWFAKSLVLGRLGGWMVE